MSKKFIYESPDNGKTIFRRSFFDPDSERELVTQVKITIKGDEVIVTPAEDYYEARSTSM